MYLPQIKELAEKLNGRQHGDEISGELESMALHNNLVVVFCASDDLMEFRGAIYDEVGCYFGGTAYLDGNGLIINKCTEDDCPYFEQIKRQAITIKAVWYSENEPAIAWTYKTDIPHSTFEIMEDGEVYCRGIVFSLSDLGVEEK